MGNNELKKVEISMAKLENDISYIKSSLIKNEEDHQEIIEKIDTWICDAGKIYVRFEEFKPIKSIVYGMVGFILISFLSAIIGYFIFE